MELTKVKKDFKKKHNLFLTENAVLRYLTFSALYIAQDIVLIQSFWGNDKVIFSFILLYSLLYTFLTLAMFATATRLCWALVAATQFTLFMALSNMGRAAGSSLLGTLKNYMTWDCILLITSLSPLLAIIFIKLISFLKHEKSIDEFNGIST